ncbi:MAG: hypothetical protein RMK45_02545 [Armatimonadota bacterium]|nr:hypothetical protein [Armatimonadota bacterium]
MALVLGALFLSGAIFVHITAKVQSQSLTPMLGHAPTTYQPALMFPENPRRLMAGLVVSVLFMLLCILYLMYCYPDIAAKRERWGHIRGGVAVVASILGIPLFGGMSILLYSRLRHPSPTLTITPTGVQVVLFKRPICLEWHQIEAVRAYSVEGEAGVGFVLSESTPKPFWRRLTNWMVDGCDVAASLAGNPEPVIALLEFYRTHPEHRHEIGTPASLERYRAIQLSREQ